MTATADLATPNVLTELGQQTLRRLMRVWFDFERQLARVCILRRLDVGTFTLDDYRRLLLHLRPQVVEGARWISRAASSFDRDHTAVRSVVIGHASDEHRDYELLEADYVACGGDLKAIERQPRNVGTEALHGYLMHRASQRNPTCLVGAMWIIEGLGQKMATQWATRIEALTGSGPDRTRFMRYHADNDEQHMGKLYALLDRLCTDEAAAAEIVTTARVVARLYVLQLEEIDSDTGT